MAYSRNNPGRPYSKSSNPFDDEDEEFDHVEAQDLRTQHQVYQDRIFQSTNRSLALIEDSHDMAIKTAVELHGQGEQLNRVEKNLDNIHNDMNTADRSMRSIKSVWGAMANYFKKPTKSKTSKPEDADGEDESNATKSDHLLSDSRAMNFQVQRDTSRYSAQSTMNKGNDFDVRLDSQLDQISRGLGRLKEDSLLLGSEIDRHNVQIERIQGKTDKATARIEKTDKDIQKMLRR